LERSAFDIVGLRRQLRTLRADLSQKKADYEHLKHVFGRYVVPDVVDELLADTSQFDLSGEVRDVTVLFSNIRGYSTLSGRMGPTAVIDLLNRYFGAMSGVIDGERGTIIEFEGDAILVVFGAPLQQPDHADRALRTAVGMNAAARQLNEDMRADGSSEPWRDLMSEFGIRIGIHSGEVVVGNVGSETRTKYAVIGDTVNIAARVEQMNKKLHTGVLFTGATVSRLGTPRDDVKSLGKQAVRGRAEDVEVFTIQGIPGGHDED
jgi:adenylate cyclase